MEKAKILAVVGLHGNTFKPHTGTKTSVLFLQKYTAEELQKINAIQSKYEKEWQKFLEKIRLIIQQEKISEEKLPSELLEFLNSYYGSYDEETETIEDNEDNEISAVVKSTEELQEEITTLQEEIDTIKKEISFADKENKKNLNKKLKVFQKSFTEKQYLLNLKTISGRLNILLNNAKDLEVFHKNYLQLKSAKELSYAIFMATSQKSGKDNSGEYVYKKDENGEFIVDDNGHLIVDNDLNFIAEKFIEFAQKQKFNFWEKEEYKPTNILRAAEEIEKYERK